MPNLANFATVLGGAQRQSLKRRNVQVNEQLANIQAGNLQRAKQADLMKQLSQTNQALLAQAKESILAIDPDKLQRDPAKVAQVLKLYSSRIPVLQRVSPDMAATFANGLKTIAEATPTPAFLAQQEAQKQGLITGEKETAKNEANQVNLLSPEEVKQLNLPEGTIVQRKPTGELEFTQQTSSGKQRAHKIADLVERGIPWDRAADIVDGREKIVIVPGLGVARLVNVVTGKVEEIPIGGEQQSQAIPVEGKRLWDMADDATGPVSSILAGGSRVLGNVGVPVAKDTLQARSAFATAMGEIRRAFKVSNRFSVGEMERIEEEIDIEPSFFDSPDALKERMKAIDKALRNRRKQFQNDANDTSLPQDVRSAQSSNVRAIDNFLELLGVPQKNEFKDWAIRRK